MVTAAAVLAETGLTSHLPPDRLAAAEILVSAPQRLPVVEDLDIPLPERESVPAGLITDIEAVPGVASAAVDVVFPAVLDGALIDGHSWDTAALTGAVADGAAPVGPGHLAGGHQQPRLRAAHRRAVSVLALALGFTLMQVFAQSTLTRVTAAEIESGALADATVTGPVSAADVALIQALPGVDAVVPVASTTVLHVLDFAGEGETEPYAALAFGPGAAAVADPDVTGGDLADLHGDTIAVANGPAVPAVPDGMTPDQWINLMVTLAMAGYILLGTANSLVAATARRRGEFTALRTIGATPHQVRAMVRREAFLLSAMAIGAGLAVSVLPMSLVGLGLLGRPWPQGPLWLIPVCAALAAFLAYAATTIRARKAIAAAPTTVLASVD
jgi:putative ABC transport system permease protein